MSGPTARHASKCPADESLLHGLRFLSRGMPKLTPDETQKAAVAYHTAHQALWASILGEREGLRAWVRLRDSGFRLSTVLAETPAELALLREAMRQRDLATAGCLGLAAAFARAHRGAGQGIGRGLVLVAPGGDALQGALEQILRALDRYDPDFRTEAGRSCKASTLAAWYAFKGVQDERWQAADARLTQSALGHWATVEDAERRLRQVLGREPSWDEIVAEVGHHSAVTAKRVSRILRAGGGDAPLDEEIGPRERPCPAPLPDEVMERADLRARIDAAAPPGSRRRRVVDALALDGPRAAAREAGSRADRDADVCQIREALAPSLQGCHQTAPSPSPPTPSPSPIEAPSCSVPSSRSATRGVVRRASRAAQRGSESAATHS